MQKVLVYGGLGDCASSRIIPALDVLRGKQESLYYARVDIKPTGPVPYFVYGTEPKKSFTAAVIATPNNVHLDILKGAVDAGLNILCEKPIAHTLEATEQMLAIERAHPELTFMLSDHYVYKPGINTLIANWDRGKQYHEAVGQVYEVNAKLLETELKAGREWLFDSAVSGGGMAVDIGHHLIAVTGKLLGFDSLSVVAAEIKRDPRTPGDAESYVKMTLRTSEGDAIIEAGKYMPQEEKSFTIKGERGTLEVDIKGNSASLNGKQIIAPTVDTAYNALETEFFSSIAARRVPFTTFSDGATLLGLIKEAYRVAEQEKR